MRGWLAVHLAGLEVEEVLIPFVRDACPVAPAIAAATPAGLVPYLEHKGARVWESLSICEYCAEQAPGLWPEDRGGAGRGAVALGRDGGRAARPAPGHVVQCRGRFRRLGRTPEALRDIARVETAWGEALAAMAGPSCSARASAWPM